MTGRAWVYDHPTVQLHCFSILYLSTSPVSALDWVSYEENSLHELNSIQLRYS